MLFIESARHVQDRPNGRAGPRFIAEGLAQAGLPVRLSVGQVRVTGADQVPASGSVLHRAGLMDGWLNGGGPLLRRAVRALGVSLADRLAPVNPLDLFLVREDGLAQAIDASQPARWQAWGATIAAAERDYDRQQASSPAWLLADAPESVAAEDPVWGIHGSLGQASGPAYGVRSPEDLAACQPGVILVRAPPQPGPPCSPAPAGIVAEKAARCPMMRLPRGSTASQP